MNGCLLEHIQVTIIIRLLESHSVSLLSWNATGALLAAASASIPDIIIWVCMLVNYNMSDAMIGCLTGSSKHDGARRWGRHAMLMGFKFAHRRRQHTAYFQVCVQGSLQASV